ncbi:MAG: PAS domain-containing protein [Desulfovibrionales bacterium]
MPTRPPKSSSWYNNFIDNLPVAVLRTTVEGQVILCNKAALELFGYDTREDFMARPIISRYQNKRDRGIFVQHLAQGEFIREIVLGMKKRSGTPIWCAVTAKAVMDEDHAIEFIDAVIRDISTEMGPSYSPMQTFEAPESSNNFVFTLEHGGKILDVIHETPQIYGYPREAVIGRNIAELLHEKSQTVFQQLVTTTRTLGKAKSLLTITDSSGESHHIECYSIATGCGKNETLELVARDITNLVEVQKIQIERQKFQGVLEMAGGVSHRLNQPLTVINHLLREVLSELDETSPSHAKLVGLEDHVKILNEIIKKIGNIKKYAPMSYVGGIRIVDIDKSSSS